MKYALFSVPVGTIYDLPQAIKEGEEGLVSTIGDEGLYGQACQVRTAPGHLSQRERQGVPGKSNDKKQAQRMIPLCLFAV